jgi:hypothetical protein
MARPIYPRPRVRYTLRLEPDLMSALSALAGDPPDMSARVAKAIRVYLLARELFPASAPINQGSQQ